MTYLCILVSFMTSTEYMYSGGGMHDMYEFTCVCSGELHDKNEFAFV